LNQSTHGKILNNTGGQATLDCIGQTSAWRGCRISAARLFISIMSTAIALQPVTWQGMANGIEEAWPTHFPSELAARLMRTAMNDLLVRVRMK
jgi:hypothetical protein